MSFAYPGTERLVLEDVCLELSPGTVVAIVGENGAGKTTLVKLLCRMYQPTSGRILVDGIELCRMPADAVAVAACGGVSGFLPVRVSGAAHCRRRAMCPGWTMSPRSRRRSSARAPLTWSINWRLGSRRSSGRPGRRAWRSASDNGRSSRWPEASCANRPLVLVLDEPTAALDAETEHALFERFAAAARTGSRKSTTRPTAASRSWCHIDSAPCAWPI